MDKSDNPFAPGAGSKPPELAGRDDVINSCVASFRKLIKSGSATGTIFYGVRGIGKTVLLNELNDRASSFGSHSIKIECDQSGAFIQRLVSSLRGLLLKLSAIDSFKSKLGIIQNSLRQFASVFKITYNDIDFGVIPPSQNAFSGILDSDLSDLLVNIGEIAKQNGVAIGVFIDEMQYLSREELSAVFRSSHEIAQRNLPVMVIGAGLPQILGLSGAARSYSERLFEFVELASLDRRSADRALSEPVDRLDVNFTEDALDELYAQTRGYPYFIQEWGYHSWNLANGKIIGQPIIKQATIEALERLNKGFFKVRYDRLTPSERAYVAEASKGSLPFKDSNIADFMGKAKAARVRSSLYKKGILHNVSIGYSNFTAPLFDNYVRDQIAREGARAT